MKCNQDCNQGRTCECDCGDSFIGSNLDLILSIVVLVFAVSCFYFLVKQ